MNGTEVWVDHVLGTVAIAWPDLPGYFVYDRPVPGIVGTAPRWPRRSYTVPGGMTPLVDATADGDR